MNTIQDCWEDFKKHCIDPDAPIEQFQDMEASFYTGAATMMNMMLNSADRGQNAAEAIIDGLCQEIELYEIRAKEIYHGRKKESQKEIHA